MDNQEIQTNPQNNDNKDPKDNPDTINRLCRFAFIMSTIGVLTIGICPAFGVIGIVVGKIFKCNNFPLSDLTEERVKKAKILGIVSLFLFVVDIIIIAVFLPKIKG